MRCLRCGYIGIRAGSKCESCHNKVSPSKNASFFGKNQNGDISFTIYPGPESRITGLPGNGQGIGLEGHPEVIVGLTSEGEPGSNGSGHAMHLDEAGNFVLDLTESSYEDSSEIPVVDPAEYERASSTFQEIIDFSELPIIEPDEGLQEIDLGEIEVEGLGFDAPDDDPEGSVTNNDHDSVDSPETEDPEARGHRNPENMNKVNILPPEPSTPDLAEQEVEFSEPEVPVPDLGLDLDDGEAEQIRSELNPEKDDVKSILTNMGLDIETLEENPSFLEDTDSENAPQNP